MPAVRATLGGADPGGGHTSPGSRLGSIKKGVLGLGDRSLSLVPLVPEGRGTAGGGGNRALKHGAPGRTPLLTSQGHGMEYRGRGGAEGPGGAGEE